MQRKLSRPTFLYGPYRSPDVKIGDVVACPVHGAVEVRGFHDKGAISAPKGRLHQKSWSILITEDLLRALRVETSAAICYFWGLSQPTVASWRQALGIDSRATESFLRASSLVGADTGRRPANIQRLRNVNGNPWTQSELELLSRFSAAEIVV